MQRERRLQQFVQPRRLREAGELQEQLVHVLADRRVAGEQAVVGVAARGARVVVAGAEVAVAAQAFGLAAHDHQHLGVRLVADHAVHDVRAGLLQAVGQVDVGLLVEARAQLDDDRDVLAGARAATSASTIGDSLPVRYSVCLIASTCGIGGAPAQEIEHRREAWNGWCSSTSFWRITANRSVEPATRRGSPGVKIGYFRSGRGPGRRWPRAG